MIDVVCDYLGRPSSEKYESVRKRIVSCEPNASINWQGKGILFTLKADSDRCRPVLYVMIYGRCDIANFALSSGNQQ